MLRCDVLGGQLGCPLRVLDLYWCACLVLQAGRQADRQTDRQTGRQTGRHVESKAQQLRQAFSACCLPTIYSLVWQQYVRHGTRSANQLASFAHRFGRIIEHPRNHHPAHRTQKHPTVAVSSPGGVCENKRLSQVVRVSTQRAKLNHHNGRWVRAVMRTSLH